MKQKMYHRFDTDDKTWEKMAPHLTGSNVDKTVEYLKAIENS